MKSVIASIYKSWILTDAKACLNLKLLPEYYTVPTFEHQKKAYIVSSAMFLFSKFSASKAFCL